MSCYAMNESFGFSKSGNSDSTHDLLKKRSIVKCYLPLGGGGGALTSFILAVVFCFLLDYFTSSYQKDLNGFYLPVKEEFVPLRMIDAKSDESPGCWMNLYRREGRAGYVMRRACVLPWQEEEQVKRLQLYRLQ